MAEIRLPRLEQGQTKIRNVPIAVTPEGFWCCPSPTVFQKTLKPKPPLPTQQLIQKKQAPVDQNTHQIHINHPNSVNNNLPVPNEKAPQGNKPENPLKKAAIIAFGEPGTRDLTVILLVKQGLNVKLSVHRAVLMESSSFFASRLSEPTQLLLPCIEIDNCEDVEAYVDTIGLMYCQELKQRLMKQSVSRVLTILKASEHLGFSTCVRSCLEYLEAVPWVGKEEEDKVVSSVLSLETRGIFVQPVLNRVVFADTGEASPHDTLSDILNLVLTSRHEKGRREMKSTVLKLLQDSNSSTSSSDLSNEIFYATCRASVDSLLASFKKAADANFSDEMGEVTKSIALEADNLVWLLDILSERRAADEFASMWARQGELAGLHSGVAVTSRCHVSVVSSMVFVGIGRGDILVCKDVRRLLLVTWLEPLIGDYGWLQGGWCRWFDRAAVEEGIGRTVLTLPLEDQRAVMMNWLGSFLRSGDRGCPNLQRAFEVWWRRAFGGAIGGVGFREALH